MILTEIVHYSFNNIECAPGYIGMNCLSKCPFPTYGTKCQEMCNCSNETCDISTGCNTARSGNIYHYYDITNLIIMGNVIIWTWKTDDHILHGEKCT